jgi:hypothetical protein
MTQDEHIELFTALNDAYTACRLLEEFFGLLREAAETEDPKAAIRYTGVTVILSVCTTRLDAAISRVGDLRP